MEFKDYYAVMGVPREATDAQVKQAYRKLARKYHPDVSKEPDAEQRFKELGEAYVVLRDPQRRAAYDQLGTGPQPGEDFRPPPDWGAGFEFRGAGSEDASAFDGAQSEFFRTLFTRAGFGADGPRAQRHRGLGEDHHARVIIDLEASFEGGSRALTLRIPETGEDGRPRLRDRSLNVRIPKGIQAGQHIRLAGQGDKPPGVAQPGDLYLEVQFAPHRLFRPEGRDLHLALPVAPWEAALGATVTLPTPVGAVELKIPAGSQSGSRLRLRGRGLPANPPGDLYATLQVILPPADNDAAREAYGAFAAALPFNPRTDFGA
ncbi:MAG TPA: DnaJ C-terminal domain-containing protein [Steroidobacteraceae bacterium]|nr:DnaJ C-terminal domain-containing protein [Steroidobacteraceae bacterium]